MDPCSNLNEFLTTRRARLTPDDVGLPHAGGPRRVPGLRREEVALVAGISVQHYVRLERGRAGGASETILDGISRALRLDEQDRSHLRRLVLAAKGGESPVGRPTRTSTTLLRAGLAQLLESMDSVPALVQNDRLDIVDGNRLGRALFSDVLASRPTGANVARFVFLDRRAESFYDDWNGAAHQAVAILRTAAERDPHDRALTELVGELATRCDVFCAMWATPHVRDRGAGTMRLIHPVVGRLELQYESMDFPTDRELRLVAFTAAPGSASRDALRLLGSWAATEHLEPSGEDAPANEAG